MKSEECKSTLDLMQPEVLSVEALRQVLSQRLVSSDVSDAPKSALVELWHRLVTPLPQRVYRNTRAGRWYAARQRRPRAVPPTDRDWEEMSSAASGSQPKPSAAARVSASAGSTPAPPSVSRLKPPPAADSGKKRIIRLSGCGGGGKRSSEGSLDGVVIKRRVSAGEPTQTTPAPSPSAPPGGDPSPPAASPAGEPAATVTAPPAEPGTVAAPPAEPGTVAENNGHGDSAGLDGNIKAKLKMEKRKIKIRRKSSADPEAKRAAVDP